MVKRPTDSGSAAPARWINLGMPAGGVVRTASVNVCSICKTSPAPFIGSDHGRDIRVCGPCRTRFECRHCGKIPDGDGRCGCLDGEPTMPAFRAV